MKGISIADYFDTLGKAQKVYGKHLEPLCRQWELTRNELDVMLFLYNNPSYDRAADIVARRGIAKSHVSLSVTTLEGKGLLQRDFLPGDRRTAHLKLTPQGQRIAQAGREAQEQFFGRLYEGVSDGELALWQRISQKISGNIEKL